LYSKHVISMKYQPPAEPHASKRHWRNRARQQAAVTGPLGSAGPTRLTLRGQMRTSRFPKRAQQPLRMPNQVGNLISILLKHYIRAGCLRAKSKAISESAKQNNGTPKTSLTQLFDEFQTPHWRHFVIGDD